MDSRVGSEKQNSELTLGGTDNSRLVIGMYEVKWLQLGEVIIGEWIPMKT